MPMGWRSRILGFVAVVAASAGLGMSAEPDLEVRSDGPPIIRCEDVPPLPPAEEVADGWGSDDTGALLSLLWTEGTGDDEEIREVVVRVDDPTCAERSDIRTFLEVDATPPRFENARIVVRPGEPRAYVGYTLIDEVGDLLARQDGITATHADGRTVEWKHQTATGGPSDIGTKGRVDIEPADDVAPYTQTGDADYFDSSGLKVGETVTVTFRFFAVQDLMSEGSPPPPRAVVKVPFRIVGTR